MRSAFALSVVMAALVASASPSIAQPQSVAARVAKQHLEAMELLDLADHAGARKKLNATLAHLDKARYGATPAAAKTHVLLGVVAYKQKDSAQAVKHYVRALQIDATVVLPKAHADAGNQALFDKARRSIAPPTVTCASLPNIEHTRKDGARQGTAFAISSRVGNGLNAHAVVVMFRTGNAGPFTEAPAKKSGECTWVAQVPGAKLTGRSLAYYIVARNSKGKAIGRLANPATPLVVPLAPALTTEKRDKEGKPVDEEVPGGLKGKTKKPGCASCSSNNAGQAGLLALLVALALVRRRV